MGIGYDLAGKVIGLAMKVHGTLGPGFLESVYQRALQFELLQAGFKADFGVKIQVWYGGVVVGDFIADLLVNDALIVEIKSVTGLVPAHEVQIELSDSNRERRRLAAELWRDKPRIQKEVPHLQTELTELGNRFESPPKNGSPPINSVNFVNSV